MAALKSRILTWIFYNAALASASDRSQIEEGILGTSIGNKTWLAVF
jgi:hypothetical protein